MINSFYILDLLFLLSFYRKIVININYVISDRRLSLLKFCGNEAFLNFCDGCRRKCYKYLLDFTSLLLIIIRCPIREGATFIKMRVQATSSEAWELNLAMRVTDHHFCSVSRLSIEHDFSLLLKEAVASMYRWGGAF